MGINVKDDEITRGGHEIGVFGLECRVKGNCPSRPSLARPTAEGERSERCGASQPSFP
jgi:hypothetical protein